MVCSVFRAGASGAHEMVLEVGLITGSPTFPFTVIGGVVSARSEPHALAVDDIKLSH